MFKPLYRCEVLSLISAMLCYMKLNDIKMGKCKPSLEKEM